ncbi:MAG: HAMP domain-containing histidine kinase [Oscillospiraceae bacterium]|nr:HAMP domain-containing histidine kinase [Oscillospiraceae bacterium]
MKRILSSSFAKLLTVVLFCLSVLAAGVGAVGLEMYDLQGWGGGFGGKFEESFVANMWMGERLGSLQNHLADRVYMQQPLAEGLTLPEGMCCRITLGDDGTVLFDNTDEASSYVEYTIVWADVVADEFESEWQLQQAIKQAQQSETPYMAMALREGFVSLRVEGYVRTPVHAGDAAWDVYRIWKVSQNTKLMTVLLVAGGIAAVLSFAALMCAAGRDGETGELDLSGWHRIPLDLYIALCVGAAVLVGLALSELTWVLGSMVLQMVMIFAAVFFWILELLSVCVTFAARFKAGKWWRNSLIYKALRLVWRALCWVARGLLKLARCAGETLGMLPTAWKALLFIGAVGVLNLLLLNLAFEVQEEWLIALAAVDIAAMGCVIRFCHQLQMLKAAGQALAEGDLGHAVDTAALRGVLRQHGENLGSVREGMRLAVEKQLQSERMRTELITNVSHDLKTPLTAIVSYVDLLGKENIKNKKALEYIEVLQRQSAKLKKLTEDLLDVSKASSGMLEMQRETLDLDEFVAQMAGEYRGRFEAAGLQLLYEQQEMPVSVQADSRYLARVFDNLLQNALKYSQADTRVYLAVQQLKDVAVVSIKNISREALNITADELMERFVRGDSSRHTEGSGLGLSIAKSLMELMGGELVLVLDGDLFKALVRLPRALPEGASEDAQPVPQAQEQPQQA